MGRGVGAGACSLGRILAQDKPGDLGKMRLCGSLVSSLRDAGIKSHVPQRGVGGRLEEYKPLGMAASL